MASQPPSPRTRKKILRPEHHEHARTQILLIMHHQQLAEQMKRELVALVEEEYGVDLRGGEWHLNVADGRLERVTAPPAERDD